MQAKSIKGNSSEEIKTALEKSMADGYKPTLAFVFISIKQDIDAVSNLFDGHGITIFGATTGGEFIDGDIGTGTIAVLLLDINPAYFLLFLDDYTGKNPTELVKEITAKAKSHFKNPAIIISCSMDVKSDTEQLWEPLIRAIESVTGPETIVWGGRAGDDFMWNETVVFTNRQSTKKGVVLLAIDSDKILIKGLAASGQKPVGTEKTITKAYNNWVYKIDNQPATELVLKYLGLNLSQEEAETYYLKNQTVTFSVAREKGDPIIRGVGLFNLKEKSIYILGNIKEGDKVRFTLPPDFEIIEEVSRNAEKIKQEEMSEADALLMFSCVGRLDQFGPLIGDEIEGVKNVFNVPMAGFFTYGEYGRTKYGNNEFHSSTCCWVAFKER
jgi:hypothetical protein